MKTSTWFAAAASLAALALTLTAWSQEGRQDSGKAGAAGKQEPGKAPPAEGGGMDEAKMAEMMKLCEPGDHHKHLEPFVGKWDFTMKWWSAPGSEAESGVGKSEFKWILNGRQLQQDVTSPMPEGEFRGMGIMGYDNLRQQYHSMWYDNMCTGCWVLTGTCDKDGKVFTFKGEVSDPMTGQKNSRIRAVNRVESKDRIIFESYEVGPDGKEHKQLEITYTRAAAK